MYIVYGQHACIAWGADGMMLLYNVTCAGVKC